MASRTAYSTWTPQKPTLFNGHYLRNRSTLDIGVLDYIGIVQHKENSPEFCPFLLGHPVYKCIVPTTWQVTTSDKCLSNIQGVGTGLQNISDRPEYKPRIRTCSINVLTLLSYLLPLTGRVLLEKLIVFGYSRNSPHFMEPEGSSPYSQVPAICPYPEPA